MGKSFRFDPRDDNGGDQCPTMTKKELKELRKQRHKRGESLDKLDTPDEPKGDSRVELLTDAMRRS